MAQSKNKTLAIIILLAMLGALCASARASPRHGVYDLNLEKAAFKNVALQYRWRISSYKQTTLYYGAPSHNETVAAFLLADFTIVNNSRNPIDNVKITCDFYAAPGDTSSIESMVTTHHDLIRAGETKFFPEAQIGEILSERAFAALEEGAKPKCRIESIHLAEE